MIVKAARTRSTVRPNSVTPETNLSAANHIVDTHRSPTRGTTGARPAAAVVRAPAGPNARPQAFGHLGSAACGLRVRGLGSRRSRQRRNQCPSKLMSTTSAPVLAHHEAEIQASLDTVWHLHIDVNGWSRWQQAVTEAHIDRPFESGNSFHWCSYGFGVTSQIYEVRRSAPDAMGRNRRRHHRRP